MCEYFPNLKSLVANLKGELDLSNYVTKEDLKKMQQVLIHRILLKRLI